MNHFVSSSSRVAAGQNCDEATCERGGTSDPVKRVAGRIREKATKYAEAIEERGLQFVVGIHGDFISCFDRDDCERAIRDGSLFDQHPELSGIIFFVEGPIEIVQQADGSKRRKQLYQFPYFANPNAIRKIDLTDKLITN